MIAVLAVGLLAMVACLGLQATALVLGVQHFADVARRPSDPHPRRTMFLQLSALLTVLMAGNIVQVALWALLYRIFGPIQDFETAMYFSGVTFTTLGYGDVLLTGRVRLLAPLEGATGVLMFGLSTATFISAIQNALANRAKAAQAPAGD